MRYIGKKTRLLGEIESLLRRRGVERGTFIDIFTGSASVARHFKGLGFRVLANDILPVSYTQAVAAVEVSSPPPFAKLFEARRGVFSAHRFRRLCIERGAWGDRADRVDRFLRGRDGWCREPGDEEIPLRVVLHYLSRALPPREGLVFRNYCPGGGRGRRYFRDRHGRRIDAILEFLKEHHRARRLTRRELHLLLAALVDAADRRANISGTYGAFLKQWQENTAPELVLEMPEIVPSAIRGHRVHRRDANELLPRLEGDVLYVDPPYNHRQYGANYHVLDVIAEHHRVRRLEAYERRLYGKTGLRPYDDVFSDFCVRDVAVVNRARRKSLRRAVTGARVALERLILSARVRHVVVSYNEEGLLGRDEIGAILARFSGAKRYNFRRDFIEIECRRFRSDRDREPDEGTGTSGRRYRVVEGKERDVIGEWLFFATRG